MLPTKAPVIYMHDGCNTGLAVAAELESLIPVSKVVRTSLNSSVSVLDTTATIQRQVKKSISSVKAKSYATIDTTFIFTDQNGASGSVNVSSRASRLAQEYQARSTEMGRNFVCVVLTTRDGDNRENSMGEPCITNALNKPSASKAAIIQGDICAFGGPSHLKLNVFGLDAATAAKKVYEHLFKVLPVKEHLHLIPEVQMKITDKSFPDYNYCALADAKKHARSELIQFVCLIESPPEIRAQRLHWRVVDRSGIGNFYFNWQDEEKSRYTWNWVLSLKPGDRKALPRRPTSGKDKNKKAAGFALSPAPIRGIRRVVAESCIANSKLCFWAANKIHPEGKKGKDMETTVTKKNIVVFDEKGEKTWDSDVETATSESPVFNEKAVTSFA